MVTGARSTAHSEVLAVQSNAPGECQFTGSNQPPQTIVRYDRATRFLIRVFCVHPWFHRPRISRARTPEQRQQVDRASHEDERPRTNSARSITSRHKRRRNSASGNGGDHRAPPMWFPFVKAQCGASCASHGSPLLFSDCITYCLD